MLKVIILYIFINCLNSDYKTENNEMVSNNENQNEMLL